ncbi:putative uncharacterized protein [Clostridium sp. CAG:1219]|nr:putative uncharacterized protein [Clostridium sp. CAG:1219]
MEKIRFTYSKSKLALYLTNDDLIRLFEKTFKKANIEIDYYKKNSPKIELASPLELGVESVGEIAEVVLKESVDISYFVKILNDNLPNGITILSASKVEPLDLVKLPAKVVSSDYEIKINYIKEILENKTTTEINYLEKGYQDKMKEYLGSDEVLVTKKSKNRLEKVNIKPLILDYKYNFNTLDVTVVSNEKENLRPETIMEGFSEYIDSKVYFDAKRTKINLM